MENTKNSLASLQEILHHKLAEKPILETTEDLADSCPQDANACGDSSSLQPSIDKVDESPQMDGTVLTDKIKEEQGGGEDASRTFPETNLKPPFIGSSGLFHHDDADLDQIPVEYDEPQIQNTVSHGEQSEGKVADIINSDGNNNKSLFNSEEVLPPAFVEEQGGSADASRTFPGTNLKPPFSGSSGLFHHDDADLAQIPVEYDELQIQNTVSHGEQSKGQEADIISNDGNNNKSHFNSEEVLPPAFVEKEEDPNLNFYPRDAQNSSNIWSGNRDHNDNILTANMDGLSLLKDIQGVKTISDWSTAVEEDYIGSKFSYFHRSVANGWFPKLTWEPVLDEKRTETIIGSNREDFEKEMPKSNHSEHSRNEHNFRIRYTRDYLLKFSDCILSYAFPEGLRQFTVTGDLPLKQLEFKHEKEKRPSFAPNMFDGMEHIMFYNDMHFISNSKRSAAKF